MVDSESWNERQYNHCNTDSIMRGNNFLNIDFGSKRQRLPYDSHTISMNGNRKAFHYSYNLINNLGNEELKKESVQCSASGTKLEGFSSQLESKNVKRKLSLPSKSDIGNGRLPVRKTSQERGIVLDESQATKHENKIDFFSGNHSEPMRSKNGILDFDKAISRPNMGQRFSDHLYKQRSLPPICFNKPRGASEGTIYNSFDNKTSRQTKIFKMSSKSKWTGYPSSSTTSLTSRKEGLSAVDNHELMQGRMRKKGVVDSTDESHYQRQFLRVLNKRF